MDFLYLLPLPHKNGPAEHKRMERELLRRAKGPAGSLIEMSDLGLHWKNKVDISGMCTGFAESEVVSLVAKNTQAEDIVHGLNRSIAAKTASLMRRADGEAEYIMTGGVAKNLGDVKALEEKLQAPIYVPAEAQLCGALGAALIAWEGIEHE